MKTFQNAFDQNSVAIRISLLPSFPFAHRWDKPEALRRSRCPRLVSFAF